MSNSLQINLANPVAGLGTFSYTIPGVSGVKEVTNISTVHDVAGNLANTYFNVNAAQNFPLFYVWYNVDGGGTDPAIAGKTGVEVDIATGDTANTIATATRAALGALTSYFVITGATNHVIVTNVLTGATTDASDGAVPTGFGFSTTTQGVTADPPNVFLTLDVQSTLPNSSALAIALKKNTTTIVSVGGAATDPTPSQPSIGARTQIQCEAGDSVSAVLTSANAVDAFPNTVKSVINLFNGA